MSAAWSRGPALLIGSLVLHLLALAAVPALFSRDSRSPLFVDLAALDEPAGPAGALARASSEPGPRPPARGDRPARGASAPATRMKPASLPVPVVPSAAVSPPAPPAPDVTAAPSVPAPSAPTASLPAPLPTPAPSPATSATGASAPGPAAPRVGEAQAGAAPAAGGTRDGAATSGGELTSGGNASGAPGRGGALLALALPGEGHGGVPAEYAPYLARFRQRVEEALVYPLAARRQGHGGRVELEVLLEPSGRAGRVKVAVSSSNAALDEAAVDAVRAVKPIPFPDGLPRRPLLVRLPLVFELR
jgi:TonB family protein